MPHDVWKLVFMSWWLSMLVCDVNGGYPMWCWPRLWEGKVWELSITHTDQGPDVWEKMSELSVDIVGARMASRETGTRFGKQYTVFHLYYYPANTLYKVQDGVCTSSHIQGNVSDHCIDMPDVPDDSVKEWLKELMGDDSPNSVFCSGARFLKDGVGRFVSVDPEGNIPLLEERQGVIDGVPSYTVTTYSDITLGIKDPSVFTPPENCIKTY